jgi:hypothetical protein
MVGVVGVVLTPGQSCTANMLSPLLLLLLLRLMRCRQFPLPVRPPIEGVEAAAAAAALPSNDTIAGGPNGGGGLNGSFFDAQCSTSQQSINTLSPVIGKG